MRYRLVATLSALLLLVTPDEVLLAQQDPATGAAPESSEPRDENLDAIRQTAVEFTEAFNRGDAKAIAELWTADGEYVDESGRNYTGREAIETGYAEFFAANPDAKLRLTVDALRLLSENSALEDGQAILEPPSGGVPTGSKYSVVHVKVDGRWLMASVRDAQVDREPANENLADLEWLIGSWIAEDHGVKTESVCRWLGDKCFVERKYTTSYVDGAEATGVQIIGWNAQDGHVQSWNFSPDGAFAVGVWSPTEGGWEAELTGVTSDGTATAAVNHLQRLDDNAYMWQSVERALGETVLPDSDEVVIRRNPAK